MEKAKIPRNAELYCIYAKGDSMMPNIMHNDMLVVNLLPRSEWQYLPKGVYLVVTPEQQMLKIMERPPVSEFVVLKSKNPEYADITIPSNEIVAIFSYIRLIRDSSII
jgi:phage repressor protein C with HTH and peptisase S24 domain